MSSETSPIVGLPLREIFEDQSFNLRIFYGDIDRLALQLMTEGQHEPIKVRRDGSCYLIVDGHRRHRAFVRARHLQIESDGAHHILRSGDTILGPAPAPLHPAFDPDRIECRIIDSPARERDLFCAQFISNSGKPFTALERMIFVARLNRLNPASRETLALQTGLSRTYIANALQLNAADPRLLDQVREGRVSQKLALRLLRVFRPAEQLQTLALAAASADRNFRTKILPKDIPWPEADSRAPRRAAVVDAVRARLHAAVSRLGGHCRFAPNPAARERLATLMLVHDYAAGNLPYGRLEAHLLGRE